MNPENHGFYLTEYGRTYTEWYHPDLKMYVGFHHSDDETSPYTVFRMTEHGATEYIDAWSQDEARKRATEFAHSASGSKYNKRSNDPEFDFS